MGDRCGGTSLRHWGVMSVAKRLRTEEAATRRSPRKPRNFSSCLGERLVEAACWASRGEPVVSEKAEKAKEYAHHLQVL